VLQSQIRQSFETNTRLAQAYSQVSQEYSQPLNQKVSEYETQEAEDIWERAVWEVFSKEHCVDRRIIRLFQHLPEMEQFLPDQYEIIKESRCFSDVKTDLEVLKALPSTRRYILEGLGTSISNLESTFEARYKLHPSVFQNSSLIISKEMRSAIDLRADLTYRQHPYWTENVEQTKSRVNVARLLKFG
jgi:ribosomal protein L31